MKESNDVPVQEMQAEMTTRQFPQGQHPIDVMDQITAPYSTRLGNLLQRLCENAEICDSGDSGGTQYMSLEDLTAVPTEIMQDSTTEQELTSADILTEGEEMAMEVAIETRRVVASTTEILDEQNGQLQSEIEACFDELVSFYIDRDDSERRNDLHGNLELVRKVISRVLGEVVPKDIDEYMQGVRNILAFVISGIVRNSLREQVTLQIPIEKEK
jgi:queuine/archaeosine tRNA-ribosyltransferase